MKKVKVSDFDPNDPLLKKIKEKNIQKAKAFLGNAPFATTVYMALKTGLPIQFILDNRKEIGI